jgi:phosphatidylglycerol---prolipoprotein diacylglyceryl transferase
VIVLHTLSAEIVRLGPVSLNWYGLSYVLGCALGFYFGVRRTQESWRGFSRAELEDIVFHTMIGVILGGRIGYTLFYSFDSFLQDPLSIVRVWDGGMSFHGGLLGVIVAMWLWARRHQRKPLAVLDFIAPLVPFALGTVRLLGNFVNGELWGRLTHAQWGWLFPAAPELSGLSMETLKQRYAEGALDAFARHPSQLYQAFLEGVVLALLVWIYSKRARPVGAVGGLFVLGYGVQRFVVEFFREPDQHLGFIAARWLTMGQALCIPMILFGAWLMWFSYRRSTIQQTAAGAREK